jgi:YhcG PDDEXK nuclease domain
LPDENPPVGLILCADKGHALARYALDGLPNKIMAANYKTVLPDAEVLQKELEKTRVLLESRGTAQKKWEFTMTANSQPNPFQFSEADTCRVYKLAVFQ